MLPCHATAAKQARAPWLRQLATVALRSPDERPHVSHEAADAGHLRGLDSNWPRTLIELGNGDALNREHQPTINRIVRNLRAGRN